MILFDAVFNYLHNAPQEPLKFEFQEKDKIEAGESSPSEIIFPADSTNLPDSTNLIDQYKDSANVFILGDSLIINAAGDTISLRDSLTRFDSLSIDPMAIDSSTRIEQFKYKRKDSPALEFRPDKRKAFYAYPSSSLFRRKVELDSTGQFVLISEYVGTTEIKNYLKIPLEEYIQLRTDATNQKIWEDIGYTYEMRAARKDLSQLITDITNISIPLPSTSFLSIFGPPKIDLRINGAVDIHGAWRSETTEGVSTSRLGNTRNEPDFKQQVQINVNGTIGDKLTIKADWNTERTFEYENQLKIKYTGYEDEIIQSIEAGNVSLQTSPLVGGSEALFGIKSEFQIGPLKLTALASQKKGEVEEVSVSGGAKSQTYEIHAYEYSENHYFLDSIYADTSANLNLFNRYYGNFIPQVVDQYRVKDLEVWKTTTGIQNTGIERTGNAFIDLPPRLRTETYDAATRDSAQTEVPGRSVISGRFIKLTEGTDYTYQPETGFVSFNSQINKDDAIAVAFRQENGPGNEDDLFYGEFAQEFAGDTSKTIILKLIKPKNLRPQDVTAWKLQLKNIYPIGGRDIKQEGFVLDVKYIVDGGEPLSDYNGVQLLQAFGLDKTDQSGSSTTPDGSFDFLPNRTIIPGTGEIIFPVLEPFGRNLPGSLPDTIAYQKVYDDLKTFAQQDRAKDKFILTGEYSASVSSTYSIGFNVVENSVRVLLNGNELREGSDYTVDYNIGQITIRNDAALVPGADLRITYEQNDLFQLASKTLIGLRGLYEFSKKTKLGFSFLNLNQQTLSDKVRIGEEPLNNSIYGVDFQTAIDLPFVTKGLDYLISTKANSEISFKGEYAYINPDPNTKKSTIASDAGKSIAYIDDFEGAKRTIPLGISDRNWIDTSIPNDLPSIGNLTNDEILARKAKTYWFNILPSNVRVQNIWGNRKQAAREDEVVTVLDFVFDPSRKGFYNSSPELGVLSENWGGMMKGLSSSANNLVAENIEFIEFWLNVPNAPDSAKIYIDLGQISEDIIPNNRFDTEDKNSNDLEEEGEDTGIDGLFDVDEPGYDPINNPDPNGDNFFVDIGSGNYENINGTEGNAGYNNAGLKLPDSEDLNRNLTLDRINSYYRYEVPIDTNKATNPLIAGGGGDVSWYLIRVPLKDYIEKVGDPSFTLVEAIRFFITGVDVPVHLRFAEMNLVGNQWRKVLTQTVTQDDEVLTVSTINVEDNPSYTSPPGVFRERDRSKPDQEVFKNEQSLQLALKDLEDGDSREVVKDLYRPLDVFNYKEMKMFIHGDLDELPGSVSHYVDETDYSSEVYFRFGADSLNYYEYRQPVRAGWNEISLIFDQLTAIKQARDSIDVIYRIDVPGEVGHSYAVLGNPTLTRVNFFSVGILNPRNKGTLNESVSGDIWINELRVLDADDSPGWAYSASSSFTLADLMTVNVNMSQTNPYFHKLADRFGSRVDRKNWGFSVNFDVLKLIPVNLTGSNLKVNFSRTESIAKPLYLPGTDIFVDSAASQTKQKLINQGVEEGEADQIAEQIKADAQTINVSDTWTVSNIKLKIPSNEWYIRDTFNSLTFNFNYNKTFSRNPTTLKNSSWQWKAGANYQVNLSKDYFFYPADIPLLGYLIEIFEDYRNAKFYYTPQSISSSLTANRKRNFQQSRTTTTAPNIQRDFTTQRNLQFSWRLTEGGLLNLTTSYNVDVQSSLTYLLADELTQIERNEGDIWRDIVNGALFGKDFNYRQTFDLKTSPKLPSLWDINRFFSLNASYNVSYNWQNNFQQEELGRSAGFQNRISAGFTLRLKSLVAPLFEEEVQKGVQQQSTSPSNRGRGRGQDRNIDQEINRRNQQQNKNQTPETNEAASDTTQIDADEIDEVKKDPIYIRAWHAIKSTAKWIFFDYDQISLDFNQTNSQNSTGLLAEGTGFSNFWGFRQATKDGPSRAFMFGLSYDAGPRANNGNLSDNFSQKNTIDFKTSRPLWENAQIDLTWKVGWGINKSTSLRTDSLGNVTITNLTSTGNIDRSFLSFPPSLFLSIFGSGIKKVNELYNPNAENPATNLSDAFVEGFESLPIFSSLPILKDLAKYVPRPNWRFSWSGLEKISFFQGFAQRVSLNHAYTSSYSEGWKINPDGLQEIQTQKVNYGFQPLLGVNVTFDKLWGGDLTGSVKYSTKTNYDLGLTTRNITESFQRDINITASYSKSGFEVPLFGISLKNDIEISFSYTSGKTSTVIFEMDNFKEEGKPQDGTTRTTIEPRIKYVMSSRVTLSLFYKRTSVEPEGAARIPPTTTNEAGLDVHISIQ